MQEYYKYQDIMCIIIRKSCNGHYTYQAVCSSCHLFAPGSDQQRQRSPGESVEKIFRLGSERSPLTDMNEQGGDLSLRARLSRDFVNIYQDYSLLAFG